MSTPTKTQVNPSLPGISKEAADQIRMLNQTVQRLHSRIANLENAGFLTGDQADAKYSPTVMARELSSNGSAPLTLMVAGGAVLIQPQPNQKGK